MDSNNYGKSILLEQAAALTTLAERLDGKFEQALELIQTIPAHGRVIVSGIGKAGFVANKVSATLASVGIPSFYLHPAEAVHGDLGRCTAADVIILLSNSGETQEISRLLPSFRRVGCKIISITARADSTLAKHSDVALLLGEVPEAGPLGLAPTTSTTLMMVLGDALAMTALHNRGFSKEQFAAYHPGGNLGVRLRLVSEIMRHAERHCIAPATASCRDVIHRISRTPGRPGAASIVDGSGKLVGIFTDGDLRRCLDRDTPFLDSPVSEFMGRHPRTVFLGQLAEEALALMTKFEIDQVVAIDEQGFPVGMVDIQDLFG